MSLKEMIDADKSAQIILFSEICVLFLYQPVARRAFSQRENPSPNRSIASEKPPSSQR